MTRFCLSTRYSTRENLSKLGTELKMMADSGHCSDGATASVDSRDNSSRDIKPEFSEDEETLIIRMYNLVGRRWRLIAGRIPGRTAEEIERFWTARCSTRI